jgi:hypothetical protein
MIEAPRTTRAPSPGPQRPVSQQLIDSVAMRLGLEDQDSLFSTCGPAATRRERHGSGATEGSPTPGRGAEEHEARFR